MAADCRQRAEGIVALGNKYIASAEATAEDGDVQARALEAMHEMASGGGMFGGGPGGDPGEYDPSGGEGQEPGGPTDCRAEVTVEEMRSKLMEMPVGQLKSMCGEAGVDTTNCVEKRDLVDALITMMCH